MRSIPLIALLLLVFLIPGLGCKKTPKPVDKGETPPGDVKEPPKGPFDPNKVMPG
jgi:hypothetical protein